MKDQDQLLAEIRTLNTRKAQLESDIKGLLLDIDKIQANANEYTKAELSLKKNIIALRSEVAQFESQKQDLIAPLKEERKKLEEKKLEIEQKTEAYRAIFAKANEAECLAINEQRKAKAERLAADSAVASLAKQKDVLDNREKECSRASEELAQANLDIESDRKKLAEELKRLDFKKEEIKKDLAGLDVARQELENKRKEVISHEEAVKKLKAEVNEAFQKVNEKESLLSQRLEEAAALIRSNEAEKEAIELTKKQVEIDRLRVEKLAKDKQVDKELAELRKQVG